VQCGEGKGWGDGRLVKGHAHQKKQVSSSERAFLAGDPVAGKQESQKKPDGGARPTGGGTQPHADHEVWQSK